MQYSAEADLAIYSKAETDNFESNFSAIQNLPSITFSWKLPIEAAPQSNPNQKTEESN